MGLVIFLLKMNLIMGERTDKIEKHSIKKSTSALQNVKVKKNKGLELKKIKAILQVYVILDIKLDSLWEKIVMKDKDESMDSCLILVNKIENMTQFSCFEKYIILR